MALTKVSGGILQQPIDVGIITATSVQVGSGTTIHDAGIDLGSGNITSHNICLLYTSPSPRDATLSRMPSSA